MGHYLSYWQLRTNEGALTDPSGMNHSASGQYGKVEPRDVVWIITIEKGELWLLGRIEVAHRVTHREAVRILRNDNLWDAPWHIIARKGTEEPMAKLSLANLARRLRFVSTTSDRLPDGFSAHHVRTLRLLTEASADLLERFWSRKRTQTTKPGRRLADKDYDDELAAFEGELRRAFITHRRRERWLRDGKITSVLKQTGALACEVPGCGFLFSEVYGEVGRKYAHVHHLRPLADRTAPEETRLEDLAVVCANCHSMIHRGGACRKMQGLIRRAGRKRGNT